MKLHTMQDVIHRARYYFMLSSMLKSDGKEINRILDIIEKEIAEPVAPPSPQHTCQEFRPNDLVPYSDGPCDACKLEQAAAPETNKMTELQQFKELAQQLYTSHQRRIIPTYPWILVRVLPKEQRRGSIILPEVQNKVLYEGIVLETWQPWWKTIAKASHHPDEEEREIRMESALKPGDHVVFPHYEGMPVPYLNEEEKDAYRLVRESNEKDLRCEVMGKLEYEQEPAKNRLQKIIRESGLYYLADEILKEFDLIPKNQTMKTLTGM